MSGDGQDTLAAAKPFPFHTRPEKNESVYPDPFPIE